MLQAPAQEGGHNRDRDFAAVLCVGNLKAARETTVVPCRHDRVCCRKLSGCHQRLSRSGLVTVQLDREIIMANIPQAQVDNPIWVSISPPLNALEVPASNLSLGITRLGAIGKRVARRVHQAK